MPAASRGGDEPELSRLELSRLAGDDQRSNRGVLNIVSLTHLSFEFILSMNTDCGELPASSSISVTSLAPSISHARGT